MLCSECSDCMASGVKLKRLAATGIGKYVYATRDHELYHCGMCGFVSELKNDLYYHVASKVSGAKRCSAMPFASLHFSSIVHSFSISNNNNPHAARSSRSLQLQVEEGQLREHAEELQGSEIWGIEEEEEGEERAAADNKHWTVLGERVSL